MRPTRPTAAVPAALAAAALLGACTVPDEPVPAPTPTASVEALPTVDPDAEALAGVVAELRATVVALREALEAAAAGDAAALQDAADLLAADVAAVTDPPPADDGTTTDDTTAAEGTTEGTGAGDGDAPPASSGPAPLLPGPEVSRLETVGYGDLLTRAQTLARSAGGAGEPVQRLLADPLAGDLGSWQRAPGDLLRLIGEAGATVDIAATEEAVLTLDGEAPRALAWVVHGLRTPQDAAESAGRALAHLAIIELALEQLP